MTFNDNFLRACRLQPVEHIPVWFMRQAGRYQPEYREIRKSYSLLEICRRPEICAEVTLLPVEQLGVDAAILFSDITLPFEPMGIDFDIVEGTGPVIHNPIQNAKDIARIKDFDAYRDIPYVGESIKLIVEKLNVPMIGFIGAPFTLASYLIEGGPSKGFYKTKSFMYNRKADWHSLMQKLTENMARYLEYQKQSGAMALMVFDSWVGNLSVEDYKEFVFPHMEKLFQSLKHLKVPLIHFGVVTGHLLELMAQCGADVVGLDWRAGISGSRLRLGKNIAVQGNLDPAALLAPWEVIMEKLDHILSQVNEPGFIFNLGHGIMPLANGETLKSITEYVHNWKKA